MLDDLMSKKIEVWLGSAGGKWRIIDELLGICNEWAVR
jgi:hypothetical protein